MPDTYNVDIMEILKSLYKEIYLLENQLENLQDIQGRYQELWCKYEKLKKK